MKYEIIHPASDTTSGAVPLGNPTIRVEFHYGELTHLVNRLEQLAKRDTSAYPMDTSMALLRELTLIRDKAMLERRSITAERLADHLAHELTAKEQLVRVREQEVIHKEQDLTRVRGNLKRSEERVSDLVSEMARLQAQNHELNRIDRERRAQQRERDAAAARAASRNGGGKGSYKPLESAFKPNDRVRVVDPWLRRSGEEGVIAEVLPPSSHPLNILVRFEGAESRFRASELQLVEAAPASQEEPVAVPV